MCSAKAPWLDRIDGAAIGVLAYRRRDGEPVPCAVTPYVEGGDVVVTSTLAFPAKGLAMRREGRAALLAGGVLVRGRVDVTIDRTSGEFDRWIRGQELRKYPPARALLAIPGHRRLVPWYVGRIIVRFVSPEVTDVVGHDRVTLTTVDDDGCPWIEPLDLEAFDVDVGDTAPLVMTRPTHQGPASVLVHEEDEAMRALRQRRHDGQVDAGVLHVDRVTGSLDPPPTGTLAELAQLRQLARSARAHRAQLDRLAPPLLSHQRSAP